MVQFGISADGQSVVYRADQRTDGSFELFGVPIHRERPPVVLNGPLPPGGEVAGFALDPRSRSVVYLADQDVPGTVELFSAPLDGSAPSLRLDALRAAGGDVVELAGITRDGTRALYLADQDSDDVFELFSVLLAGSLPPVRLNPPLGPTGDVQAGRFASSPDGRWIVYLADPAADEVFALFSAPADGSAPPARLDVPLDSGREILAGFEVTSDGAQVLYQADLGTPGQHEIHVVPIDGSRGATRLTTTVSGPVLGDVAEVVVSPGGSRAVYRADQQEDEVFELLSVPTDGSASAVRVSGLLVAGGDVGLVSLFGPISDSVQVSPDGTRVVYYADQERDEVLELFSAPIDGGAPPTKLNGPLVPGGDVGPYPVFSFTMPSSTFLRISADGSRVVYLADQRVDGASELFSVPIDGSAPAIGLNGPLVPFGDVQSFALGPDGSHAVYLADQAADEVVELFSVAIDGSAPPVRLNGPLAAGRDVAVFAGVHPGSSVLFSPDGSLVLYLADEEVDEKFELFLVPVDASRAPVKLNAPLPSFGDVGWGFSPPLLGSLSDFVQVGADGLRVVYFASPSPDPVMHNAHEIFSVMLDRSAPPEVLNAPLVPGGSVLPFFSISPDAARVVYVADQDTDDEGELYSVPIDASSAPVKLNAPLVPGGDIEDPTFIIHPASGFVRFGAGGSRVVYAGDQDVDGRYELFSVPLDGSLPPARLCRPDFAGSGLVFDQFDVSPDGSQVVYLGDQDSRGVLELFLSPIDGSSAPVKVNGPLVPGGDVEGYRLCPDGRRAVYLGDQDELEVIELYASPLATTGRP